MLVCEEAHRYVPASQKVGFEPCRRAIAKIAKEGRKYGVSLCIVTQRPAEIDPTIVSQCNTVFALRMSNDRDQEIVKSALSDTGSGLLEFLSALGQREALAFGDGVALPVRIKFDELPADVRPRSSTAAFSAHWQRSVGDEGFLEQIVEKWRSSVAAVGGDATHQAAILADEKTDHSHPLPPSKASQRSDTQRQEHQTVLRPASQPTSTAATNGPTHNGAIDNGAVAPGRTTGILRKQPPAAGVTREPVERPAQMAAGVTSSAQPAVTSEALKSLRERLIQRQQR